jgi:hypothetical protein
LIRLLAVLFRARWWLLLWWLLVAPPLSHFQFSELEKLTHLREQMIHFPTARCGALPGYTTMEPETAQASYIFFLKFDPTLVVLLAVFVWCMVVAPSRFLYISSAESG